MTVWHSQSPRFVRRDCNRFRNHDFDEPLQHQLGMGKKERKDVNADIRKEQLVEMCGKKKKLLGYGSLHTFLHREQGPEEVVEELPAREPCASQAQVRGIWFFSFKKIQNIENFREMQNVEIW